MRFAIVMASAAFLIVGCKSKDKMEDHKTTPTTAQSVKSDAKAAVKDAKKAVKDAAASATSSTKVECKNKGETRTLEVRGKDKGCETAYTKSGAENVVGSSQNGTSHCEGIMNKIKDKLIAAGYTCN